MNDKHTDRDTYTRKYIRTSCSASANNTESLSLNRRYPMPLPINVSGSRTSRTASMSSCPFGSACIIEGRNVVSSTYLEHPCYCVSNGPITFSFSLSYSFSSWRHALVKLRDVLRSNRYHHRRHFHN